MLFEKLNTPEIKEKMQRHKETKQRLLENYSSQVWQKFKNKVRARRFPDEKMFELIKNGETKVDIGTGFHYSDGKKHITIKYSYYEDLASGLLGINWDYQYCEECRVIVSKHGTALNGIENLAETFTFTNNQSESSILKSDEVTSFSPYDIFDGKID